jgi:zinc protease
MSTSPHVVEQLEVDGVPTFRVDVPLPAFALLQFRVGRSDEPLTHSGITHLVEHLAFRHVRHVAFEHNGVTEPLFTRFFAEGSPEEAHGFVRRIVDALVDPDLDRVGREAHVLAEEAADRNTQAVDLLRRARFGATAHGRPAFPELGLWWLTADEVAAWLTTRFTRENATLVVNGPVPEDLGLDRLPSGQRWPLPPVEITGLPTPRHAHGPDGLVAGTMLVRRDVPLTGLAMTVLERTLEERLRHDRALVYETWIDGNPLDDDRTEVLFGGLVRTTEAATEVAKELGELLAQLADDGPDPELFAAGHGRYRRGYTDVSHATGFAVAQSEELLRGLPSRSPAEELALLDELTADDVRDHLRAAVETVFLTAPEEVDVDEDRFGPCDDDIADPPVHGRDFAEARIGRRRASLVVGDDAVGLRFGDGAWWRVPYAEVEAAIWYPDGSRELVTRSGMLFPLEPTHWRKGHQAVAAVDARLPADRFVPAREDGDVPVERSPQAPETVTA